MAKAKLTAVLGAVLRERREAAGLSQEELAAWASLHRNYVGLVERGERNVTIAVLHALARALDGSASSILAEVEARLLNRRGR